MEFVNCDFRDCTFLSKGHFSQTWQDKTFEQTTIMGDTIPGEVSDDQWLEEMMNVQTIPERSTWKPSAGYYQGLAEIQEQTAAAQSLGARNAATGGYGDGNPAKFDFSRLGRSVQICPSVDNETFRRKMANRAAYAVEQEQERRRDRESEALQRAFAESSRPASSHTLAIVNEEGGLATTPQTDQLRSTVTNAGDGPDESACHLFSALPDSVNLNWRPLQTTNGNVQRSSTPPHLRGRSNIVERASADFEDEDGDDDEGELDDLVYQPASRLQF